MKKEEIERYKQAILTFKMGKGNLPAYIKENQNLEKNEKGEEHTVKTLEVYVPFTRENGEVDYIKIATIDEQGVFNKNTDILNDNSYSEKEKENLKKIIEGFGIDGDTVDMDNLKEQLEKAEAKTIEQIKEEKEHDKEETIRDDNEGEKENKEEKDEKDVGDLEKEAEQKALAKKIGIKDRDICKIRRDSQFYKNYPNIPKTAYFYLDANDRMHAEYIDKDGTIKELQGFEEIKDRDTVTRFGHDGEDVKSEMPYRVMTAEGLEDNNHNTQDVRIAIYKDTYGYLRIETIHQGRNGEWEGKNIDTYGRDRNTSRMNKLIDEEKRTPKTGVIAERQQELVDSGYSVDGLSLDEMSKQRKINEYMQDGYTEEEAYSIYDYVVGEKQLSEDDAKVKVSEEREVKIEEDEGGRTPGGDALDRLYNRH